MSIYFIILALVNTVNYYFFQKQDQAQAKANPNYVVVYNDFESSEENFHQYLPPTQPPQQQNLFNNMPLVDVFSTTPIPMSTEPTV